MKRIPLLLALFVTLVALNFEESAAAKAPKNKGNSKHKIPHGTAAPTSPTGPVIKPPLVMEVLEAQREAQKTSLLGKLSPSELNYIGALGKCAPMIKQCPLTSLGSQVCPLACIFDKFPHLRHTIYLINEITLDMCTRTTTVFDGAMRDFAEEVKTIADYIAYQEFTRDEALIGYHAAEASLAIPFQIIKLSNNTAFDGLKLFLGSIYASNSAARIANIGFKPRLIRNNVCDQVDYTDSTQRLAEEMISKPALADLILDGYFTLSHVAPMGSAIGPISPAIDALSSVLRAFTGVDCGLIDFAATGSTFDCSTIVGKKIVNVKPSGNVKPKDGDDPICGVKMDIPPADFNSVIPNIFPHSDKEPVYVADYVPPPDRVEKYSAGTDDQPEAYDYDEQL